MRARYLLIVLGFFPLMTLHAQGLPIQKLEEVVVSDVRVKRYAEGHKVTELRDSTIQRNGTFITSLLNFNSNIYFKENGLGMVSSPAFRGTNASHTAVIWNGININSQLNGQVDFNTINPLNYSSIAVRSGGGSVQFGTGAIGGSVHLNNDLKFEDHFEHQVLTGYGSFDTRSANYSNSFGKGKWSSSFGINYNSSDNDYVFLETDERNTNGEFEHVNINFNAGYVLGNEQVLRLYHQSFAGDRNLSGTLVAPGRSRYMDNQHRTQLEWSKLGAKVTHRIKAAHLYDAFKFFENKDTDFFSEGRVTTLLARYSLDIELSNAFRLNSFLEYNHFAGDGSSFGTPQRNDISITSLLKHRITDKLRYNLSLRQDISSDFSSPVVFSVDGSYDVGKVYTLRLNASRNFRLPTFNDLYWQPGGNLDLRPEQSYQMDLGHQISWNAFAVRLNSYYITTEDMIRWLPNTNGIWSPINVDDVQIYGAEVELGFKQAIGEKQEVDFKANYAYTVSEDNATGEQLIYVPFHRANASLAYRFGNITAFYQHLYNGEVRIIGGELEGYQVANAGFTYGFKTDSKLRGRLGLTLNNVFNAYYENIALRPMPNRNIQTQLVLNF